MAKLLLVDDDIELVELLTELLRLEGFQVEIAHNGQQALNKLDSSYDLVLLEDDLQFFPPYTCSLVVDNKVLEKYPNLEETLHRLDNKITTETMQKLNYESDGKKLEPQIIAKQFLEENNYFREE